MRKGTFIALIATLFCNACSLPVPIPESDRHNRETNGLKADLDRTAGKHRIIIDHFGDAITDLGNGSYRGNGFFLRVYKRGHDKAVYTMSNGEIDSACIVDISKLKQGIIRITDSAWDPRRPDDPYVPFSEKSVMIQDDGTPRITRRLLLKPEPYDDTRISKLTAEIIAECKENERSRENYVEKVPVRDHLGHLRNMAPGNPEKILSIMRSLPTLPGECSCGHFIGEFLGEVVAVRDIQKGS